MASFPKIPLAELHAHLSTSISPTVLWQMAHESGFKLPEREFEDFRRYITLSSEHRVELDTYFHTVYHPLLNRLSSGVRAVEQATYHTMAGAYHTQRITTIELRNNPMKHNTNGELDLDHVIMAMLRGMERALLECKDLSAGLIFCIAREFDIERNAIIIEKAIKYRSRGVVGIDVAGPGTPEFKLKDYASLFDKAKRAGLKVTVHTGEARNANDMWEVLEQVKPARIGHGVLAAYDKELMKELVRRKVVLEVCPMSNIATKSVENMEEMKFILRTFVENKVRFCINTDWPEVIEDCHLRNQLEMLLEQGMLSEAELLACNRVAFEASFIPKPGGLDAYL